VTRPDPDKTVGLPVETVAVRTDPPCTPGESVQLTDVVVGVGVSVVSASLPAYPLAGSYAATMTSFRLGAGPSVGSHTTVQEFPVPAEEDSVPVAVSPVVSSRNTTEPVGTLPSWAYTAAREASCPVPDT
jgi:hypothetical protein